MLRLAIFVGTAGLFATFLDQLAASIVLYLAALTAIGVFVRKYVRPAWRKYGRPLAQLAEHMETMEKSQIDQAEELAQIKASQDEIVEHVDTVDGKVEIVSKQVAGVVAGTEISRDQA